MKNNIEMHHPDAEVSVFAHPGQIEHMKNNGWLEGPKPKSKNKPKEVKDNVNI